MTSMPWVLLIPVVPWDCFFFKVLYQSQATWGDPAAEYSLVLQLFGNELDVLGYCRYRQCLEIGFFF
jgi:hypothetical protein